MCPKKTLPLFKNFKINKLIALDYVDKFEASNNPSISRTYVKMIHFLQNSNISAKEYPKIIKICDVMSKSL